MVDVVFLGVNDIGERVYEWLTDREDATVRALLTEKSQLDLITRLEPDLLISSGFRHIVPEEVLSVPDLGAVNFHKSYLPYNRGANPNVWSIVEDNPAGVTLHFMTPEIDAGPVINRREVPVYPGDTGRSLYERLESAQWDQFRDVWPALRDGAVDATPQSAEGTEHVKQDFVDLWKLDRAETVNVGTFLDRLRALSFPPYRNAYFEVDGEKYHVDVRIRPAEGSEDGDLASEPAAKNVPRYDESGDGT